MSTPPSIFNPSPTLEATLLDALTSEHHSLASLATLAATSIEQLTLWLARPAIRDRVAAIESGAAWHLRFVATIHLSRAVAALSQVLTSPALNAAAFPSAESRAQRTAPDPRTPSAAQSLAAERTTIRAAETIRRAASSLILLARFKPIGPTAVITTGILPVASAPRAHDNTARPAAPTRSQPPPPQPQSSRREPTPTKPITTTPTLPLTLNTTDPFLDPLSSLSPRNRPNNQPQRSTSNILQAAGLARAP